MWTWRSPCHGARGAATWCHNPISSNRGDSSSTSRSCRLWGLGAGAQRDTQALWRRAERAGGGRETGTGRGRSRFPAGGRTQQSSAWRQGPLTVLMGMRSVCGRWGGSAGPPWRGPREFGGLPGGPQGRTRSVRRKGLETDSVVEEHGHMSR